jgi:hypothetical protein
MLSPSFIQLLPLLSLPLATALPAVPAAVSDSLASVPDSDLAFTLFTATTPVCSRHLASYHTYTYNTSSLGTCQGISYDLGFPYRFLQLEQLPEVFPVEDIVLKFYTDKHCQFSEEEHELGGLKLGKCTKTTAGGSLKVLRVVGDKKDAGE